jgi:hypothetical protein
MTLERRSSAMAFRTPLAACLVTLALAIAGSTIALSVPDTACNHRGPGGDYQAGIVGGPPHVYVGVDTPQGAYYADSRLTQLDVCPGSIPLFTFSGDFGLGLGSVWLFADPIVSTCVDPLATPHHGAHNTVHVADDVMGAYVALDIMKNDRGAAPCSNDVTITPCPQPAGSPCDPGDEDVFVHTAPAPFVYVDASTGTPSCGGPFPVPGVRTPLPPPPVRSYTLGDGWNASACLVSGVPDGAGGWIGNDYSLSGATFQDHAGADGIVVIHPTFDFQAWHVDSDRNVWAEAGALGSVWTSWETPHPQPPPDG